MSYKTGEALILAQIRNLSTFDSTNSSSGIFNILNTGSSKSYAILRSGGFEHEQKGGGGAYVTHWTTYCMLFVKLKDYGESLNALYDRRNEIITRFDQYPHAGNSAVILDLNVTTAPDITEVSTGGGPVFLQQQISIEWMEENNVTLQE